MTLTKSTKKTKEINFFTLSKRQKAIAERRIAIYEKKYDAREVSFYTQLLTMATFPHRSPSKNNPAWMRVNGNYRLIIHQFWDEIKKKWLGFPSGIYPRLILMYIIEQVIKTGSRRIYLGDLTEFMKALGLDYRDGRERKRLREQLNRLFRSNITFEYDGEMSGRKFTRWQRLNIASGCFSFWENKKENKDSELEKGYVWLTHELFGAINAFPVPIDMRVIRNVKNSPLAIDLYTWSTAKVYQLQKKGVFSQFIAWEDLHCQFGSEYGRLNNFIAKSKNAFSRIKADYTDLKVTYQRGCIGRKSGLIIRRTPPSVVPMKKQKKIKKNTEAPKDPKYWKINRFLQDLDENEMPKLSEKAIQECLRIAPQYDPYRMVEDWLFYWKKKGCIMIRFPDKAFLAFVKKSISRQY